MIRRLVILDAYEVGYSESGHDLLNAVKVFASFARTSL